SGVPAGTRRGTDDMPAGRKSLQPGEERAGQLQHGLLGDGRLEGRLLVSGSTGDAAAGRGAPEAELDRPVPGQHLDQDLVEGRLVLVVRAGGRRHHGERLLAEDRKSTRLNSSHVKSSYAVFCLKKKINT